MKKKTSSWFQNNYFLVILTYIVMQVSSALIATAIIFNTQFDEYSVIIITNIVMFSIGLLLIYRLLRENLRKERLTYPLSFSKIIGWAILGFFLAYVGQIIAVTIELTILDIQPGSDNTDFIVHLAQQNTLFLLLPALIGPIIEELVFRKVLFGSLRRRMNIHLAAVIAAFIFSVAHMDFEHLIIYFVMGLVFTFIYVKTNRIIVPILAHMSMNSLAVVAQMIVDPEDLERMREQLSFILLGGWF